MAARRVAYTADAERDLFDLWDHIADGNPAAADRMIDRLKEAGRTLAATPRMGRARPELRSDCRSFAVGKVVIFYREIENGIEVLHILHGAILHGARDIEAPF
jgi:toxin ParE1/3/4